jgi:hypothetical protein
VKEVFGRFSFSLAPLVEIWLEQTFVELGHASEGSSPVEEIELFVVFLCPRVG